MRHSARARALIAALLVGTVVVATAGIARAQESPPSTTEPPTTTVPTPVVPTTAPRDPSPSTSTTTTTVTTAPGIPADPHGEPSALSPAQTEAVETELAGLTADQRGLLRELQAARDRLAVRRFALVATAAEVNQARATLEGIRTAERQARARVDATRSERNAAKAEVTRLAAAAYRNGADSWAIGAIGTVDVRSAGGLTRAQTYARAEAVVLDGRLDDLTTIERRLEGDRLAAENARIVAERGAADLDAQLADRQRAYADATKDAENAQAEVVRSLGVDLGLVAQMISPQLGGDRIGTVLAFVQAGQTPPASLERRFVVPVADASLSSYFGLRIDPIRGNVGFHGGLDFGASSGAPIRTPASGIVVIAEECGGYGNCVVIDHGSALATLYGHMSEIGVRVGDVVTVGQVIGLVGSTGRSTGPHLHFEVRVGGTPVDPLPTLFG